MDDETIAGDVNLDTGQDYDRTDGFIDESLNMDEKQPPDYLVSLYVALNQLTDARKDILVSDLADKQGRYASIAITDLEKLIAFVSIYLTNDF